MQHSALSGPKNHPIWSSTPQVVSEGGCGADFGRDKDENRSYFTPNSKYAHYTSDGEGKCNDQTIYYIPFAHPDVPGAPHRSWNPANLPLRKHEHFIDVADQLQSLTTAKAEKDLAFDEGIKGLPALHRVGCLDFARSFPWDIMHLFFENIVRILVNFWTGNSKALMSARRITRLQLRFGRRFGRNCGSGEGYVSTICPVNGRRAWEVRSGILVFLVCLHGANSPQGPLQTREISRSSLQSHEDHQDMHRVHSNSQNGSTKSLVSDMYG